MRLANLAVACSQCPVPQKWIGSSVAIGFDCGKLPLRSTPEADIRKTLRLHIFDWGRSELNTVLNNGTLSEKDRQDRAEFWRYYVGGIERLAWRAANMYHNHFGNNQGWSEVILKLVDFDSASENDFLGLVKIPLKEAMKKTAKGQEVTGQVKGGSTITYSLEWRELPQGSRLHGAWRVRILRARALGCKDLNQLRTTSDPQIEVIAISTGEPIQAFRQFTTVKARCNDPEWNETFEIPVAAQKGEVQAALNSACPGLGADPLGQVLPSDFVPQQDSPREKLDTYRLNTDEEKGLQEFKKRLETQVHSVS